MARDATTRLAGRRMPAALEILPNAAASANSAGTALGAIRPDVRHPRAHLADAIGGRLTRAWGPPVVRSGAIALYAPSNVPAYTVRGALAGGAACLAPLGIRLRRGQDYRNAGQRRIDLRACLDTRKDRLTVA